MNAKTFWWKKFPRNSFEQTPRYALFTQYISMLSLFHLYHYFIASVNILVWLRACGCIEQGLKERDVKNVFAFCPGRLKPTTLNNTR